MGGGVSGLETLGIVLERRGPAGRTGGLLENEARLDVDHDDGLPCTSGLMFPLGLLSLMTSFACRDAARLSIKAPSARGERARYCLLSALDCPVFFDGSEKLSVFGDESAPARGDCITSLDERARRSTAGFGGELGGGVSGLETLGIVLERRGPAGRTGGLLENEARLDVDDGLACTDMLLALGRRRRRRPVTSFLNTFFPKFRN